MTKTLKNCDAIATCTPTKPGKSNHSNPTYTAQTQQGNENICIADSSVGSITINLFFANADASCEWLLSLLKNL